MALPEKRQFPQESLIPFKLDAHVVSVQKVTPGEKLSATSLGPIGTFSEEVALKMLDGQAELSFSPKNGTIVERVNSGEFDLGVVAFENSTEGTVIETLKAIIHADLKILGEHTQQITQNLFGTESGMKTGRVHSHPQAFAQTRRWLAENIKNLATVDEDSTAKGVKIAAELDEMGIGTMRAGEVYNLPLLQQGIEDNKLNFTRFWLIGRGETKPTGNDRTWIALTLKNEPGSLVKILTPFVENGVSVNKIDTPPLTMDHYYFFIAIDGHQDDEQVKKALEDAGKASWRLEKIGSFAKSIPPQIDYEPAAYLRGWIPDAEKLNNNH